MLTSDIHDTGYHELTDEEIVEYTRDVDGDEESEDDEGGSQPMVSHSEACCALETCLGMQLQLSEHFTYPNTLRSQHVRITDFLLLLYMNCSSKLY